MESSSSQVRVIVRIRPFLPHEQQQIQQHVPPCIRVTNNEDGQPAVILRESNIDSFGKETNGETMLTFDGVYDSSVSQQELFDTEVLPHIDTRVFSGCTATLFCYGMTGTGKSHTMNGQLGNPGLIPRTMKHLFDSIQDRIACGEQNAESTIVSCSYFELFNEKIYGQKENNYLLKPAPSVPSKPHDRSCSDSSVTRDHPHDLPVREDANGKIFIANLHEQRIESFQEFEKCYAQGMKNRKIASTKYNTSSSRAHTMIQIKVEFKTVTAPFKKVTGKIQLLDLAGNEDNRYSGNTSSKSRMVESSKINNSLFVLGKVINSLNAGDTRIPYRDSKLTRLLCDSLGGTNYSIMICNVSPNPAHMAWTQRTLTFAMKSRQVVNTVEKNVVDQSALIAAQQEEERKADLKAKLDQWKRERERSTNIGSSTGMGPLTAASKAKRLAAANATFSLSTSSSSSLSSHPSSIPTTAAKTDPSLLKKLHSLTQDVNTMKAALAQQQKQQHQQFLRPSSAQPPIASSASTLSLSSARMVPLTPVSSAHLARNSVEKAKVWEKNGHFSRALEEYREAARLRPGNEKLKLKIQQIEVKAAREQQQLQQLQSQSTSPSSTTVTGNKHPRDLNASLSRPPSKHRKLNTSTKTIPEEESEEDDDIDSDDEDIDSPSEPSADDLSDEEDASDYDPMDDEDDPDAVWMKRVKSRSTRSNRSTSSSASTSSSSSSSSSSPSTSKESSPTTSPSHSMISALMQRIESMKTTHPILTTGVTDTNPITRSSTSPTTTSKRSKSSPNTSHSSTITTLRTPLGPIQSQSKVNLTKPSATSPPLVTKTVKKVVTPPISATSTGVKGKENVAPSTKSLSQTLKSSSISTLPISALPSANELTGLVSPSPKVATGLLLSNLVSGRDNLLRLLNHGSLKELMELQTIGKKRAQLIMAKREEMGGYVTLSDLSHIGLSENQVEQFTQRNLMSNVWNTAQQQQQQHQHQQAATI